MQVSELKTGDRVMSRDGRVGQVQLMPGEAQLGNVGVVFDDEPGVIVVCAAEYLGEVVRVKGKKAKEG